MAEWETKSAEIASTSVYPKCGRHSERNSESLPNSPRFPIQIAFQNRECLADGSTRPPFPDYRIETKTIALMEGRHGFDSSPATDQKVPLRF